MHLDTKISELEEVNTQLCSPQKSVEELSTGIVILLDHVNDIKAIKLITS